MQGVRIADGEYTENPGEYSKHLVSRDGVVEVCWMVKVPYPPNAPAFYIGRSNADGSPNHWIQEHEDGTITVQPMPLDAPENRRNSNSILSPDIPAGRYHGYIHAGVWDE